MACKFPYLLSGDETTTCIYERGHFDVHGKYICPTMVDAQGKPIEGSWRECKDNCQKAVSCSRKGNALQFLCVKDLIIGSARVQSSSDSNIGWSANLRGNISKKNTYRERATPHESKTTKEAHY